MRNRSTLAAFALCSAAVMPALAQPVPDAMPSLEQFERAVQPYPYQAPSERTAKIKAGLVAIERCTGKSNVQALLGVPDYSDLAFGPKGPGEKWLGSIWVYYLSKQSRGANENDSMVTVFFDTKGLAHWVVPQHLEGAKEIGAVFDKCA